MKKLVGLLFLLLNVAHACGLCSVYSPETLASINVKANEEKIQSVDVVLKLTEEFTQSLIDMYDTNGNFKFEDSELKNIQMIFEEYAKTKRYFLTISYDKVIRKETFNKVNIDNFKTTVDNGILHFRYSAKLDYKLYANYFLSIKVDDDEKFFLISLNEQGTNFSNVDVDKVFTENSVVFAINSLKPIENTAPVIKPDEQTQEEIKKEVQAQTSLIKIFTQKVKSYLLSVKEGDSSALITLLLVSFVYGIIHAAGPGHGKSLAFTYFTLNRTSLSKAFMITQASAFVHIVGAMIMVMISVFVLESVLNNFVNDSVLILTKISAVMIILLACYILYNRVTNKDCACSACCSHEEPTTNSSGWSAQAPKNSNMVQLNSSARKKQDLYFVLTSGLIPCPGTVVLFIYAFILKTYFAVLLASIFISLGMGLVIFLSAFFGLGMNKLSGYSHKITAIVNIVAPLFMILLGVLLYMNASLI